MNFRSNSNLHMRVHTPRQPSRVAGLTPEDCDEGLRVNLRMKFEAKYSGLMQNHASALNMKLSNIPVQVEGVTPCVPGGGVLEWSYLLPWWLTLLWFEDIALKAPLSH